MINTFSLRHLYKFPLCCFISKNNLSLPSSVYTRSVKILPLKISSSKDRFEEINKQIHALDLNVKRLQHEIDNLHKCKVSRYDIVTRRNKKLHIYKGRIKNNILGYVEPINQQPNENNDEMGFIYLLKEREFIKTNENVFKIGKTKDYRKRFAAYPNDSQIYFLFYCKDVHNTEKFILKELKTLFIQRTDIGREYFECDENELIPICLNLLKVIKI